MIEAKGWKDPSHLLASYRALEQAAGALGADRAVVLPKDADDKAGADALWTRLGRPQSADGYDIKLPDGADKTFSESAKTWFFDANLTKEQAEKVTAAYQAAELDAQAKLSAAHDKGVQDLKTAWGADYDRRLEVAKAALTAAGVSNEERAAIEIALGPFRAANLLEFFGKAYVDGLAPGAGTRAAPGFSALSPGAANAAIDAKYADKAFMDRYNSPDPRVRDGAVAEMNALFQAAARGVRT